MANWERKSSYLLREIVKFRTYIDCLQAAQMQKEKLMANQAAEGGATGASTNEEEKIEESGSSTLEPVVG